MIERNIVQLAWWEAMASLKLKLNGYRRFSNRVYIGVTADPPRRWAKHANNGWCKMVLLYEAFTPEIARKLECDLIDFARRCNFRVDIDNVGSGGEGISGEKRSNYLYVLVG